ncbi:endonuclease/exonuclease/phosphatase family protein [Sphingomicrobium flavum]|uniref:endonuclease/exonuclease/phosphatase family protein n=1 Tax=Sphingomicrobium flavum TaxID=1229164 RepID=UPI0021AD5A1F|nr:endonuclease/exonuclease/phosphatase family protein [Sphingomicrobium flavum]
MHGLLILLSIILIVAAFLPLWQTDRWWVRVLDFPRLQLAGVGIVAILLYWASEPDPRRGRSLWILSMLVVATAWQLVHSVRYLPFWPQEVAGAAQCQPDRQFTLLGANVLTPNDEFEKLLAVIEEADADVILLTESDSRWEAAMAPIHADYPQRLSRPLDNTYGMHLYSRLPFNGRFQDRVETDIPSIKGELSLRDGSRVTFHGVHPEPPHPGENSGERDAELVLVGREVREDGGATLVFGDMNDVAWSSTSRLFLETSGMGDPRVGRRLMPTFNAKWPLFRWPLDHLFVSPHFSLVKMERLDGIGSDHFPVLFTLCLTDDAEERLVAPEADAETEAEADEQLQEGQAEAVDERNGEN